MVCAELGEDVAVELGEDVAVELGEDVVRGRRGATVELGEDVAIDMNTEQGKTGADMRKEWMFTLRGPVPLFFPRG